MSNGGTKRAKATWMTVEASCIQPYPLPLYLPVLFHKVLQANHHCEPHPLCKGVPRLLDQRVNGKMITKTRRQMTASTLASWLLRYHHTSALPLHHGPLLASDLDQVV